MTIKLDDRLKVKKYTHEKEALEQFLVEFLSGNLGDISKHVANAVEYRLRIVNRELKLLGAE